MINREEYEVLKELDDKYKWIARDGFKSALNVYNVRPTRSNFINWWLTKKWFGRSKTIIPYFFLFIKWTDSEPYFIPDLIKEYEDIGDVGYALKEFAESLSEPNKKMSTESEEEMKKDKEWLKEEIESKFHRWYNSTQSLNSLVADVNNSINQLDEPKVLSQELPVIPKYVAEWIEGNKQSEEKWSDYDKEDAMNDTIHFTIYGLFADYPATNSHVELRKPVLKWLSVDRGNYFKLVNAVRYGYEVEEEPLYYVPTGIDKRGLYENYLAKDHLGSIDVEWADKTYFKSDKNAEKYRFTEQEIRSMPKGDIYFKYFAVPVEVEEDER